MTVFICCGFRAPLARDSAKQAQVPSPQCGQLAAQHNNFFVCVSTFFFHEIHDDFLHISIRISHTKTVHFFQFHTVKVPSTYQHYLQPNEQVMKIHRYWDTNGHTIRHLIIITRRVIRTWIVIEKFFIHHIPISMLKWVHKPFGRSWRKKCLINLFHLTFIIN